MENRQGEKPKEDQGLARVLRLVTEGPVILDGEFLDGMDITRTLMINGGISLRQVGSVSNGGLPVPEFATSSEDENTTE